MQRCLFPIALLTACFGLSHARAAEANALDRILREENAGRKVAEAAAINDLAFLRRVTVDLIGRIPSESEIRTYLAWPVGERRAKAVDHLMKHERFTDRWTIFFADLLRLRANAQGGAQATLFVYRALLEGMPYDEMVRQLLMATGKPGSTPEAGFIISDDADPMVLAGATSQVFMGVRMACAQCHNHPFDTWTREQFYGLAAFFGKVRKMETRLTKVIYSMEVDQTSILWPPEEKALGKPRKPVKPTFPFEMDEKDGEHVAKLQKIRADLVARAAKNGKQPDAVEDLIDDADKKIKKTTGDKFEDNLTEEARKSAQDLKIKGGYQGSELRQQLAAFVTSPRNKQFGRAIANRLWADLVGRGIVEPVDDFRQDNPASHPKTLDYLAEEFIASNYDFRYLVKLIVTSEAYQRGHLPGDASATAKMEAEKAFVATPVRRMLSEVLYDSIVQAGHIFEYKFREGENAKVIKTMVREAVPVDDDEKGKPKKAKTSVEEMKRERIAAAMKAAMPTPGGYDVESALELAVDPAKIGKGDFNLDAMRKMSTEEIEAERMAMMKTGPRVKYVEKMVEQKIDDNPKFISAMRMASPAPPAHFLRIFGQPARDGLGDHRDHSASMRQALLMLNGKLTNEAARVGTLEPVYKLIAGPKKDVDAAIQLAYREILTREPTATELAEAKEVLSISATPLEGMADLRWVLLNCHEFRFVP